MLQEVNQCLEELITLYRSERLDKNFTGIIKFTNYVDYLIMENFFEKEVLNNILEEIVVGMENKDFMLVADILEYEIYGVLKEQV